jgi:hypothetical protein
MQRAARDQVESIGTMRPLDAQYAKAVDDVLSWLDGEQPHSLIGDPYIREAAMAATSIVGRTVASVEVQQWAGFDSFKDNVTWERTVLTFDDGTTWTRDSWDGDVYDEYRCTFDDQGFPVPIEED